MKTQDVVIRRQFRGPPDSGNGGYVSGVVAQVIDGPATVTLRLPPPLDRPLSLASDGKKAVLQDDGVAIAEGLQVEIQTDASLVPDGVSLDDAAAASADYVGFDFHYFPGCFVCGPDRNEGEGLRIFPGPIDHGQVAAVWDPHPVFAADDGLIASRFVWAALDCPSYFAIPGSPFALLGRLTATIKRRPHPDQSLVVMGWAGEKSGRKHQNASAIYTVEGELVASSQAVWIEIADLPFLSSE